ncbi:MAG: 2-oxo acid dehydrogenase subunit E2 [Pseudomonadales bacterium]|nr:2-oxo acid dehydrogenase subunit E2 [Pseudomonadales bacterium]
MSAETIQLPDLGGVDEVEVIEISVEVGQSVELDDPLVVLESDKASMEIPAPFAGVIKAVLVAIGDTISEGHEFISITRAEGVEENVEEGTEEAGKEGAPEPDVENSKQADAVASAETNNPSTTLGSEPLAAPASKGINSSRQKSNASAPASAAVHAGPSVRKLARQCEIDLSKVPGSGPKGRVLKEDLKGYIAAQVKKASDGGLGLPQATDIDFTRFGEIETVDVTRIGKKTAENLHASWVTIPHVTQFSEADITDLEQFRKRQKSAADAPANLTPLPFILKAVAHALQKYPLFKSSLKAAGDQLVMKQYCHIGMAVDTPAGLMVPVIRDVDKKSVWQLSIEIAEIGEQARNKKLRPDQMQGGCFTVSSLGNLGGLGFTPIINAPEVAILGVAAMQTKPVFDGEQFLPRKMLPLALSYDHRVINGADGGRFSAEVCAALNDLRIMIM